MGNVEREGTAAASAGRRGLKLVCIALLLVGMAGGATAGWASEDKLYRGATLIYIQPSMATPKDPCGQNVLPMFQSFVAYQVELAKSRRVATMAMEAEAWKSRGDGSSADKLDAFLARRHVEHTAGTQHLKICFVDVRPEVALAGAQSLLEAYRALSVELEQGVQQLETARNQLDLLSAKLQTLTGRIAVRTAEYGGLEGLAIRHEAFVKQLLEVERLLAEAQLALGAADGGVPGGDEPDETTPAEIAVQSVAMADLLLKLALLKARLESMLATRGGNNAAVGTLRREIAVYEKRIATFAADWNRARKAKKAPRGKADDLKLREAALHAQRAVLRAKVQALLGARGKVEELVAERSALEQKRHDMTSLKDQLAAQLTGKGRITVADSGALPQEPWRDDRLTRASTWGGLGALPGLLALLFFGFLTPRRANLRA